VVDGRFDEILTANAGLYSASITVSRGMLEDVPDGTGAVTSFQVSGMDSSRPSLSTTTTSTSPIRG
jgi:hypothetical protein